MDSQVIDMETTTRDNKHVQLWVVYYGNRVAAITICVEPYFVTEPTIEFPVTQS